VRILITGPECSGKSTLAKELSERLVVPWFPEYARTYLEENGSNYTPDDIVTIAREHHRLLNTFPQDQPLILDTYLLNLKLWLQLKYGQSDPWIEDQLSSLKGFTHILLLKPDLPWEQDGMRENPDDRADLFQHYVRELDLQGCGYEIISDSGEERLWMALDCLL